MINKYYAIDAHCHIYPEKIASKAVAGTDNFYGLHSVYAGTVTDLLEKGESYAHRAASQGLWLSQTVHHPMPKRDSKGGREGRKKTDR